MNVRQPKGRGYVSPEERFKIGLIWLAIVSIIGFCIFLNVKFGGLIDSNTDHIRGDAEYVLSLQNQKGEVSTQTLDEHHQEVVEDLQQTAKQQQAMIKKLHHEITNLKQDKSELEFRLREHKIVVEELGMQIQGHNLHLDVKEDELENCLAIIGRSTSKIKALQPLPQWSGLIAQELDAVLAEGEKFERERDHRIKAALKAQAKEKE